jgi:hypothetical protein
VIRIERGEPSAVETFVRKTWPLGQANFASSTIDKTDRRFDRRMIHRCTLARSLTAFACTSP